MCSASADKSGGIFVPTEQVEVYVANGWTVVHDLNPHQVLMLPPTSARHRPHDRTEDRAHDS
jgi:hypothetical protein